MYRGDDPFMQPPHLPGEIVVDNDGGGGEEALSYAGTTAEQLFHFQPQQQQQQPPPSNQLALSFQGEFYVFDSVPPEKVQAVLLLLNGQELPSDVAGMAAPKPNNVSGVPQPTNAHRLASLMRYKEKRKNLNFDKRVLYTVRKEVASRMKRNKGQFASSKSNSPESDATSLNCDPNLGICQEETSQPAICLNCQTREESTPMMRRGPAGPRSLCNACGLMWANKGMLRSLTQVSTSGMQGEESS
uniref:GATA transcription factor 28 n=1 Tax=Ananas comosus var. bracteatus TaxID=296719 RepID=A0A6V7PJU8_ANACO|nr:unnamed protein product [Ananas comosus var. bracteatus]